MKSASESEVPRVRCEITERGPRIVIPIGGEEVVVSTERSQRLRDEITQALRCAEIDWHTGRRVITMCKRTEQ